MTTATEIWSSSHPQVSLFVAHAHCHIPNPLPVPSLRVRFRFTRARRYTGSYIMLRSAVVFALLSVAAAFNAPASIRPALIATRAQSPLMQKLPRGWKKVKSQSRPGEFSYLNTKTGQRYDQPPRDGNNFFDDEKDTVTRKPWQWQSNEEVEEAYAKKGFRSPQEAAGFAADGGDLATEGGIYYVAFIPFLLLFVAYLFGARAHAHTLAHKGSLFLTIMRLDSQSQFQPNACVLHLVCRGRR